MNTGYMLDPSDRIVAVDEPWITFAKANGAGELADRVVGQSLWTFIASGTLRALYRTLLTRVRATESRVTLSFRCDSPTVRRFMMLAVGPGPGPRGTLEVTSILLREEPQPPAARMFYTAHSPDLRTTRPDHDEDGEITDVLTMCSTCKRLDIGGWHDIEVAIGRGAELMTEPVRPISHGLCPVCRDVMLAALS